MSDKTGISWCDATWNPVRGCSRVSEGCRHCYAERIAARFSGPGQPYAGLAIQHSGKGSKWTGEVRLVPEHLADPLRWRTPRRIFVNSMSDLFHEKLSNEQIAAVFGVMTACPQHTFQVLTKRARRMREWFEWLRGPSEESFTMRQRGIVAAPNTTRALLDAAYEYLGKARKPELDAVWHSATAEADPWPLLNVWIGTSVENQAAADERIPELLATPAAVRFLSCEPLLGPVTPEGRQPHASWCLSIQGDTGACDCDAGETGMGNLDWVIAGCESGPGARPCDVAWLRSLRDQCAAAGVPYFLKQARQTDDTTITFGDGSKRKPGRIAELPYLDGVRHAAFPVKP